MDVYIEIIIFSEIYDSPNIVIERPCNTGMKTMLTSCFELIRNLVIYFLISIFSNRNPKVESSLEPRELRSEYIRRVITKCLNTKYQHTTKLIPKQGYIIIYKLIKQIWQ